jgi:hypothetical protein
MADVAKQVEVEMGGRSEDDGTAEGRPKEEEQKDEMAGKANRQDDRQAGNLTAPSLVVR